MILKGGEGVEMMISGCPIFYEIHRHANDAAPVVLLLHGWGCDSTIFSFIASSLLEGATVITLDFPGHGKSGEPSEPWTVGDFADMVRRLLSEQHFAQVDIIAHSFGGRVALWLASHSPTLVRKLILTGGAGIKKPVSSSQSKRTKRYKRYSQWLNRIKAIPAFSAPAEKWQTRLRNHYGSPDYVKLDEIMRQTFVKVISEDLLPLLGDIQAPTLLVWGSADTETPLWMGQQMEQNIPDAGLVILEGRSHFAFVEEWQRFVLIAKQFLLEDKG